MTWLMNNLSTIIVCIALVAVVVLIINKMIKDKKKGKSSCGCGCSNCAWQVNATANTKKYENNSTFDVLLFFFDQNHKILSKQY